MIEDAGPGEEVHVQQIADRAGLSRTVLYRHFADRADLDRAIQTEIVDQVTGEILPVLSLDGAPVEVIRRIVAAYVGWAAAHPALHRYVELDVPGEGPSPLSRMVEQVATQIEALIAAGAELLEVPLDDNLRIGLDPLVFGVVGAGMGAVRRWTGQTERVSAEVLIDLVSRSIWWQIAGLAAAHVARRSTPTVRSGNCSAPRRAQRALSPRTDRPDRRRRSQSARRSAGGSRRPGWRSSGSGRRSASAAPYSVRPSSRNSRSSSRVATTAASSSRTTVSVSFPAATSAGSPVARKPEGARGQRRRVEAAGPGHVLVDGAVDWRDEQQRGVRVAVADGVEEPVHGRPEGATTHQRRC